MTERSTARHRASHRSSTPLSTLTGSLPVVKDYMGTVRRSGVIIAMSSGLVASMALPASAVSSAPVDAAGPQTASIPAVPSGGTAFFAVPEGGLLSLPSEVAGDDDPVTAPITAAIDFDHTSFVAVPGQPDLKPVEKALRAAVGEIKVTDTGDDAPAPTTRKAARTAAADGTGNGQQSESEDTDQAKDTGTTTAGGSQVLAVAARYLGVPYRWGGTTPRGFDCSGYTQYVYRLLGKEIPRTVAQQRSAARIISRSQARPGDLVIFGTSHIGIYAGDNKMYDAPHSGKTVTLREIYSAGVVFGRV